MFQTLAGGWPTLYYRFVGRARSADPGWPEYSIIGGTFPVIRWQSLDDVQGQGAWVDTIAECFDDLNQQLHREGWPPAGHGAHWWSAVYRRPSLDWNTSPDVSPDTATTAP